MDIEKIKENIEEEKVTAFVFRCPKCGKEIRGPTENRVVSLAEQHIALKHR